MNDLPASERHFTTHHLCMLWVPEMHAYLYIKPGAVPNPCHLLTVCQQKDRSIGLDRENWHLCYLPAVGLQKDGSVGYVEGAPNTQNHFPILLENLHHLLRCCKQIVSTGAVI